jgi:hypothetical protein
VQVLFASTEIIEFFPPMFRRATADETILPGDETISRFSCRRPETADSYQPINQTAHSADAETGDSQMRTLSFILAFAFILAGPSIAGSSDNSLPGIGTFAYTGSPIATSAPQPIVVAAAERN